MKNGLYRIFLCLLSIMLLSCCFVACGEEIQPVMSYKGSQLPDYVYRYFASVYKTAYLSEIEYATDTDAFWDSECAPGKTHAAHCKEIVNSAMRRLTAGLFLFDEYKLSLSNSLIERIDADIAEKERYRGEDFQRELEHLGITKEQLKNIYILQERYTALKEYWVGSNGQVTIYESDLENYYQENYACIKHIKLYMRQHVAKREDGSFYLDRDLTEAECQEKQNLLSNIAQRALSGEDFATLQEKYAEESVSGFPNGLLFDRSRIESNAGVFSDRFLNEVDAMLASDAKVVYFEDGELGYVLYRTPKLPARSDLTDGEKLLLDGLSSAVRENRFVELIDQFAKDVVEEELLSGINFQDVPINRGFNI